MTSDRREHLFNVIDGGAQSSAYSHPTKLKRAHGSSAFAGGEATRSRSVWQQAIIDLLTELSKLNENWDTYGAPKISPSALIYAGQVLQELWCKGLPIPTITPISSGGVMAEWEKDVCELTIEIDRPMEGQFLWENEAHGELVEKPFGADLHELSNFCRTLALGHDDLSVVA